MAANEYVKLWIDDYRLLLEPYSMEERGRIIWAMITYKGNRVDRETPSGNSFLGLDNSLDRLKRRPLRKRAEEVPPD